MPVMPFFIHRLGFFPTSTSHLKAFFLDYNTLEVVSISCDIDTSLQVTNVVNNNQFVSVFVDGEDFCIQYEPQLHFLVRVEIDGMYQFSVTPLGRSSAYSEGESFSPDDFVLSTFIPKILGSTGSSSGGSVDLSSITAAISALDTKLSNKIDSLDVQIPDDLNSKLSILQTNIQNLDLSSLNIGDILLGSSLNGNMCRYKDGDTVRIQGLLGDFTVVWSNFLRFGDQDYTVFYQVSRDVGGGVLKYQFVPEALVFYPTEVI